MSAEPGSFSSGRAERDAVWQICRSLVESGDGPGLSRILPELIEKTPRELLFLSSWLFNAAVSCGRVDMADIIEERLFSALDDEHMGEMRTRLATSLSRIYPSTPNSYAMADWILSRVDAVSLGRALSSCSMSANPNLEIISLVSSRVDSQYVEYAADMARRGGRTRAASFLSGLTEALRDERAFSEQALPGTSTPSKPRL